MKLDRREPTPAFNKNDRNQTPTETQAMFRDGSPSNMKTRSYHVEAKKKFLAKNNFEYSNSFLKLYYTKQATLALKDMKT